MTTNENEEQIDHPAHYGGADDPFEVIKIIEAWCLGFSLGNALKYIARAGKKTPDLLTDLKKARWYLARAITRCYLFTDGHRENNTVQALGACTVWRLTPPLLDVVVMIGSAASRHIDSGRIATDLRAALASLDQVIALNTPPHTEKS